MSTTQDAPKFPDLSYLKEPFAKLVHWPEALKAEYSVKAFVTLYVGHIHYEFNGRRLLREESTTLVRTHFYNSDPKYHKPGALMSAFENPGHAFTISLQKNLRPGDIEIIKDIINDWFVTLLRIDPASKLRANILGGFIGKFPEIVAKRDADLRYDSKYYETSQYILHYGLVNRCEDDESKPLTEDRITKILAYHWKARTPKAKQTISHYSQRLRNPNHKIHRIVSLAIDEYKDFLKSNIEEWVAENGEGDTEGTDPRAITGTDYVARVTEAMGASSLGATASASASTQPIRRGLRHPVSILETSSEEEEEEEETQEVRGKGKGKQKQKRQRSDTPEVEDRSYRRRGPPPPPPSKRQQPPKGPGGVSLLR